MGKYRLETLAVHGGQDPDPVTGSRAVPVSRTSAYVFKSAAQAADLFALKTAGNIYTRLGNPTEDILESRMALLEGGAAALALASGTSAIFYAVINLAGAGDEIVAASNLYGGTYVMFTAILPQFGITVRLVPPNDFGALEKAINEKTRAVYAESIGNPGLDVADVDGFSRIARKHGLPLIVDATFATPALCRPIEHGADIVVHSLSKWLGGHGTAIGGIVVDANRFDWKDARFNLYNEPDASYHGLRWAHDAGGLPPYILRMRAVPLRNLGACLAPDNVWMFLQGLETLHLRMQRHCENALAVAGFLRKHPKVAWVRYPGLADDPAHALASKYLHGGFGGMVVFGVAGGKEAGQRVVDSFRLFSNVANVGDAKSLALHPASTTHAQLTEAQQREAGLSPEMIRLSIGIEHRDDILDDLETALARA